MLSRIIGCYITICYTSEYQIYDRSSNTELGVGTAHQFLCHAIFDKPLCNTSHPNPFQSLLQLPTHHNSHRSTFTCLPTSYPPQPKATIKSPNVRAPYRAAIIFPCSPKLLSPYENKIKSNHDVGHISLGGASHPRGSMEKHVISACRAWFVA